MSARENSGGGESSHVKKYRLKEFLTLFRLQTGAVTAIAPVFGYILAVIIVKGSIDEISLFDIILLFCIGIMIHIFLFVYNEYRDVDIDRLSPDLQEKPLVKGVISEMEALKVVYYSLFLPFILVFFFYPGLWPIALLVLVFAFNAAYDVVGKKVPGADIFIAFGIFLSVLFGASVVIGPDFGRLIILTGALAFMQIMFNNSVEGGLKDVDHDHTGGARTLANLFGVKVRNNKLHVTTAFKFYSYSLKIIHITILVLLLFTPALYREFLLSSFTPVVLIILLLLVMAVFFTMYKFLNMTDFDREKMKRVFSAHEISTFYLVPVAFSVMLGLTATLIIMLFPLIWYMTLNVVLYGQALQPRV